MRSSIGSWAVLSLVGVGSMLASCGSGIHMVRVPQTMLSAEGVTITAMDGSFTLRAGQPQATPFDSEDCVVQPVAEGYPYGEQLGARRVRVQYPGLDAPLYGILAFCPVNDRAARAGPVSRSYSIRIPERYVSETADGRITVVYEPYGWNVRVAQQMHDVPAWVLWLSREPFPGGA